MIQDAATWIMRHEPESQLVHELADLYLELVAARDFRKRLGMRDISSVQDNQLRQKFGAITKKARNMDDRLAS